MTINGCVVSFISAPFSRSTTAPHQQEINNYVMVSIFSISTNEYREWLEQAFHMRKITMSKYTITSSLLAVVQCQYNPVTSVGEIVHNSLKH